MIKHKLGVYILISHWLLENGQPLFTYSVKKQKNQIVSPCDSPHWIIEFSKAERGKIAKLLIFEGLITIFKK